MNDRKPYCIHLDPTTDSVAIDELLDELVGINQHVVLIAAVRAGLEQLRADPSRVSQYITDQRCAQRVRLRGRRAIVATSAAAQP